MTQDHGTTDPTTDRATDRTAPTGARTSETGAAMLLWAVVAVALAYGVGETVVRVTQLFG